MIPTGAGLALRHCDRIDGDQEEELETETNADKAELKLARRAPVYLANGQRLRGGTGGARGQLHLVFRHTENSFPLSCGHLAGALTQRQTSRPWSTRDLSSGLNWTDH